MQIEDQVCSLDHALQLKEAGLKQDSLFYWNNPKSGPHAENLAYGKTSNAMASAFTTGELGAMIPDKIFYKEIDCFIFYMQCDMLYYCCIRAHNSTIIDMVQVYAYNEATARANLVLTCIKEGVPGFEIGALNEALTK